MATTNRDNADRISVSIAFANEYYTIQNFINAVARLSTAAVKVVAESEKLYSI